MKRHEATQRRLCEDCDKRVYSRKDATYTAKRINHDARQEWPVGPYPCPRGAGWHVGHLRARKLSRRMNRRAR